MKNRINMTSMICRACSANELEDIPRDNRVAIAIELLVDKLFMGMYCRRSVHTQRSVVYIRTAMLSIGTMVSSVLKGVTLNSVETSVLNHLDTLNYIIINNSILVREVESAQPIEDLIRRSSIDGHVVDDLIKQIKLVLAIANQIDYDDTKIVVPFIRVGQSPYTKAVTSHDVIFNLARDVNVLKSIDLWYRLYYALRFTIYDTNPFAAISTLCAAINIGTLPDAATGLGLTRFTYEAYVASDLTRRFFHQSDCRLCDDSMIMSVLSVNNPWMSNDLSTMYNVGSLEADFTDSVSPDNPTDNGGATDDKADNALPDAEDPSSDDNTDLDPTNAPDKSVDASNPDANTPDDPSASDGLDNTDESRPVLLGLNLTLAKNETLDDFMYKVSVAKFVDTVIEFNHDELPTETVAILSNWKSSLLFLTDAGETVRLLKELNIKLK